MNKHIIRTSDRKDFKRCRTAWDFGSKIRMDYEPTTISWHLEFGIAVHAGLEKYYHPDAQEFPLDTRVAMAISEFVEVNYNQLIARGENPPIEVLEDYRERRVLGTGMLTYYCGEWAPENDKFKVVAVEQEFEVPVLVPFDQVGYLPEGFWADPLNYELYYKGLPVVYQGRIDLIVEDEDGELWIVDHKTASSFKEDTFHLDVDTQVTSYAWAAQFFVDKPIAGVIYSQIKKAFPQPPKLVYKGTKLSKDKSQATTYDYYVQAIEDNGFDEEDYEEFLDYLWDEGPQFVRRFELHRSQTELDNQGRMIYHEALDMLGEPSIYPNPSEFTCRGCPFQAPCLARLDGSDSLYMLQDPLAYRKRSDNVDV